MPRSRFLHPEGKSGVVAGNLTLLEAAKELGFCSEPRLWRQCLLHDLPGRSSDGRRTSLGDRF